MTARRIIIEYVDDEQMFYVYNEKDAETFGELRTNALPQAYADLMLRVTRGDLFKQPSGDGPVPLRDGHDVP